jgi:hypothetical protein
VQKPFAADQIAVNAAAACRYAQLSAAISPSSSCTIQQPTVTISVTMDSAFMGNAKLLCNHLLQRMDKNYAT